MLFSPRLPIARFLNSTNFLAMEDILANPRNSSCDFAHSRKRAHTVRDFFVSQWKLDKKRFRIFAHGAKRPAASNATPHGRAKNRRVIVLLIP
jgi:hypothetical protein